MTSSGRLPLARWTATTAGGLAAGLAVGAAAVDYRTGLGALAAMGAVSGLGVALAQAAVLPAAAAARRSAWVVVLPGLWALGWTVTTLVGIDVEQRYVVFGASGALVFSAAFALAVEHLASPASPGGESLRSGTVAGR